MFNSVRARHLSAAILLCGAVPQAQACATCQCGDYTQTLIGVEKSFSGRIRVGVDFLSREEQQGRGPGRETLQDQTYLLSASYSFSQDLSLAIRVPYVSKQVDSPALAHEQASGLGDMDVVGKLTLGRSGGAVTRHLWGVQAGLRAPTSSEQKNAAGMPISTDAQPGTGAWSPSLGVWYGYFRYPQFLYFSVVGSNPDASGYQGLNPGQALITTLTGQYAVTQQWSVQLGLENRWAAHNRFFGVEDGDSGGAATFLAPGLSWSPLTDVLIHVSGQIPVINRLYGDQKERGDIRAGIVFDLPN